MKVCRKCNFAKDGNDFPVDKTRKDGRHPYCKECHRKKWKIRKETFTQEDIDKARLASRKHKLRKHGLTISDYDIMVREQNGVCAICNKTNGKKRLVVDHCHETDIVRGLLCNRCNLTIGAFDDDVDLIVAAANYVQDFKNATSSSF